MLIVCPSCASEYTIDPAKLGAEGRTLRCAICRDTWFVTADGTPAAPEPEPEPAIAAEPEPEPKPMPGATLLPPAAPPPRRKRLPARRLMALAAAVLLAVLAFPAAEHGWPRAQSVVTRLVAPPQPSLAFREIRSEIIGTDGMRLLVVEGEIANSGDAAAPLLPLEFLVSNGKEQVLATWTQILSQPAIGPGETVRFASRLASPPADGRQVRVHFTKAGGIAVASR